MPMMSVGDTIDAAIKVVSARWTQMALAVLAVLVPVQAVNFVWNVAVVDEVTVSNALLGLVTIAISVIGTTLATAACYQIVVSHREGRETDWQESLQLAMGRLGSLIALAILTGLLIVIGLIACVLPGIWIAVALAFGVPVLLVEGVGATDAMSRSFNLVKNNWWAAFGRLLLGYILVFVAAVIISLIVAIPLVVAFGDDGTGGSFASALSGLVGSVITTPFMAALVTIVYFDLRGRQEGGAMPAAPGSPAPPSAPSPPASVPAPGGGWGPPPGMPGGGATGLGDPSSAAPTPPAAPPAPPTSPPAAPPEPPTGGTSATSGSLWSSGDPLSPPEPPATAPEPKWEPPSSMPAPPDEPGPSAPPPSDGPPQNS
jgi:hypothetical protein